MPRRLRGGDPFDGVLGACLRAEGGEGRCAWVGVRFLGYPPWLTGLGGEEELLPHPRLVFVPADPRVGGMATS